MTPKKILILAEKSDIKGNLFWKVVGFESIGISQKIGNNGTKYPGFNA